MEKTIYEDMLETFKSLSTNKRKATKLNSTDSELVECLSLWLKTFDIFELDEGKTIYEYFIRDNDDRGRVNKLNAFLKTNEVIENIVEFFPKFVVNANKMDSEYISIGNIIICNKEPRLNKARRIELLKLAILRWFNLDKNPIEELGVDVGSGSYDICKMAVRNGYSSEDLKYMGLDYGNPLTFEDIEGVIVLADNKDSVTVYTKDIKRLAQGIKVSCGDFIRLYNEDRLKYLGIDGDEVVLKDNGQILIEYLYGTKVLSKSKYSFLRRDIIWQ